MIDEALRTDLHRRLDAARADLLDALSDVTERDFATVLPGATDAASDGETVVQLLARVAAEERSAAAEAAVVPYTPRSVERPMPPQVIHALAGARHRTRRYVEAADADEAVARRLVEAAEEREGQAAERIRARPPLPPLPDAPSAPEIPMIPPEQARRA